MNLHSANAKMAKTRVVTNEAMSSAANGFDASMASNEMIANKSTSVEHICRNRCRVEKRIREKSRMLMAKAMRHATAEHPRGTALYTTPFDALVLPSHSEYKPPSSIFPTVDR